MIIQNKHPDFKSLNTNTPLDFHYSLCEQIRTICSPLFEFLSLDSFSYSRIYKSGLFLYISTHKKWMKTFQELSLYNCIEFQEDYYYLDNYGEEGTFLYMGQPEENGFLSHLYNSGIWNCLTLFLKKHDITECWTFSSTPIETKVLNLYLNKPDIFKHFSTYFNREFQDLIKTYDQEINAALTLSRFDSQQGQNNRIYPYQELEIQKYYLSGDLDDVYLSKRETECLYFLSKGNTIKEIGKSLMISPRTVEVYIQNAKMKTQLKSKTELLDLFEKEGLKDAILYSHNHDPISLINND